MNIPMLELGFSDERAALIRSDSHHASLSVSVRTEVLEETRETLLLQTSVQEYTYQ